MLSSWEWNGLTTRRWLYFFCLFISEDLVFFREGVGCGIHPNALLNVYWFLHHWSRTSAHTRIYHRMDGLFLELRYIIHSTVDRGQSRLCFSAKLLRWAIPMQWNYKFHNGEPASILLLFLKNLKEWWTWWGNRLAQEVKQVKSD